MPLNWDDDEEDITQVEYRKTRPINKPLVHDEVTCVLSDQDFQQLKSLKQKSNPVPRPLSQSPIAHSKERFAAFLIDSLILVYFYWGIGLALAKFFTVPNLTLLHQSTARFAIHWVLTLMAAFLYYVFFESISGRTLGKWFTGLRVIQENGEAPTLSNIFIRNFLRLLDYPFLFIVALVSMESSPLNQRLGDKAAKTLVIHLPNPYAKILDLRQVPLASTISRIFAELVDLILSLGLIYASLLLCRPSWPKLSLTLVYSLPIIFIAYYTLIEKVSGSSPGKYLFRRCIVSLHGAKPDGASILIRNLFRPLDYFLGYPLLAITRQKQRLGDLAGETLVLAHPAEKQGLWLTLVAAIAIPMLIFLGLRNPENFYKTGLYPWQGLVTQSRPNINRRLGKARPNVLVPSPQVENSSHSPGAKLKLIEFYFSAGPSPVQVRQDGVFRSGDLIFAFFKVQGFTLSASQESSLTEDLKVQDPSGQWILDQPKVVQLTRKIEAKTQNILFANHLKLPASAPPGEYKVYITIRDEIAHSEFSFEKRFELQ